MTADLEKTKPLSRNSEASEARDFSRVMGFEALRICTQGKTQKIDPEYVLIWMRLMLDLEGA